MTGLKMTTMTVKEMRAARERGESETDLEFLHHNQLAGLEPEDDEDAPDAPWGAQIRSRLPSVLIRTCWKRFDPLVAAGKHG